NFRGSSHCGTGENNKPSGDMLTPTWSYSRHTVLVTLRFGGCEVKTRLGRSTSMWCSRLTPHCQERIKTRTKCFGDSKSKASRSHMLNTGLLPNHIPGTRLCLLT